MIDHDAPAGSQVIPTWRLTWEEPKTHDATVDVSMVLVDHPTNCTTMDEEEEEEEEIVSEGYLKDNTYQVRNLMYDIPMQDGAIAPGLDTLIEAVPLVALGNNLTIYSLLQIYI